MQDEISDSLKLKSKKFEPPPPKKKKIDKFMSLLWPLLGNFKDNEHLPETIKILDIELSIRSSKLVTITVDNKFSF
jgi:hypothetical protein